MKPVVLCLVLLLAGCSNMAVSIKSGKSSANSASSLSVNNNDELVAVATIGILAWLGYYLITGSGELVESGARRVPDMAPERRVSEQDCTKPIDWSAGNLRCK